MARTTLLPQSISEGAIPFRTLWRVPSTEFRNLNRLVEASLERIASAIESGNQNALADEAARASRKMQRLVDAASAIINGATSTVDQSDIDNMFER